MARPTKLTLEIQDRIVSAIAGGNYLETSARYAGISPTAFYQWMSKGDGKSAKSPYKEFRQAVEKARSQAEIRNVALIQQAGNDGSWQAAAWYLERSYPMRWGRNNRLEVTGAEGTPVKFEISVDELEKRVSDLFNKI
jgi:hypothetical protein